MENIERNNKKIIILILVILLILILLFFGFLFNKPKEYVKKVGDLVITFEDDSNLIAMEIVPGDKIIKEFTIENIGDKEISYSINIKDITGNVNSEDYVYNIKINDEIIKDVKPNEDGTLQDEIKIKSDEIQECVVEFYFVNESDNDTQEENTYSSSIEIKETPTITYNISIIEEGKANISKTIPIGAYSLTKSTCTNDAEVKNYDNKNGTLEVDLNESTICDVEFTKEVCTMDKVGEVIGGYLCTSHDENCFECPTGKTKTEIKEGVWTCK